MKILLTGKDGQVGFELSRSLAILGQVVAVDQAECDFADEASVRSLIREIRPDVIVNPAAYTAVDRAEGDAELARLVNAVAPTIMAEEANKLGSLFVHFSTDYVFDGNKRGAYTELDAPNPLSVYGATKYAGELGVQEACSRHLILRTSWVVGAHGNNFPKTMLRLAQERDSLSVVSDQFGAPTSASFLADLTAHLVRQASTGNASFPYGLYHSTAAGKTNWHEYACYVIKQALLLGKPIRVLPDSIKSIATADYPTAAKRPLNSLLDCSKLSKTFGFNLPSWQSGLDHILDQIL